MLPFSLECLNTHKKSKNVQRHCCAPPSLFHYASTSFFAIAEKRHDKLSSLACIIAAWWNVMFYILLAVLSEHRSDLLNHHMQTWMELFAVRRRFLFENMSIKSVSRSGVRLSNSICNSLFLCRLYEVCKIWILGEYFIKGQRVAKQKISSRKDKGKCLSKNVLEQGLEILLSFNLSRLLLKGLESAFLPFIIINFFSIFLS